MSVMRISLFVALFCFITGGTAQATPTITASPTTTVPSSTTPALTHPPIPPPNVPALPSEFSDIPRSVISCWDAHANYSSASSFLSKQLVSSETFSWSSYGSTSYSLSTYLNEYFDCQTTPIPSLTTLCDGYARASSYKTNCQTVMETYTWTVTGTGYDHFPPWSTEISQLPSPTCTAASDFGPVCSRLVDAYNWRKTYLQSQTPSPTGSIAGPECSVLNSVTPGAQPTCLFEGGKGTWEAYYWPTPIPTGAAFCNSNGTNMSITATPTIPGQANTAVVSGLTLTSPSVYHFLRNMTLLTLAGRASQVGETFKGELQFPSSTTAPFVTVAQRESDILTLYRQCAGSGPRRFCTFYATTGFAIADETTVRATEYCGEYGCRSDTTIYQDDYHPSLGVAYTDIVAQNKLFSECTWTTTGERIRTAGVQAYNAGRMSSAGWHALPLTSSKAFQSRETAAPGMGF